MTTIVFDFDGVIFDTVYETLFISYNVYKGNDPLTAQPIYEIPESFRNRFIKYRYLVADPIQFKWLWSSIEKVSENKIEASFYKLLEGGKKQDELFIEQFFSFREELKKTHLDTWLSLCKPYPFVVNFIKTINKEIPVYISSNKDESSIHFLLTHANIKIALNNVFGMEHGAFKPDHFKEISQKSAHSFKEILFIEDNFKNFNGISELGVQCYLATWGYNNPSQNVRDVKSSYTFINQEDLFSLLK